ncbi:MAG: hypothetical protein ACJ76H_16370 [Bacteriovoracaceae bacterium]
MKFVFLALLFCTSALAEKVKNEEEMKKAAEVLGATYTPRNTDGKSERLIDFDAPEAAMNDEEKEIVLANYERRKGDYKEDSSDTLFEKISKAYVRNLDRILVKKKSEN